MSAGLEQQGDKVTFVAVREHGWHQLGTVVPGDISVAEGLRLAHLADLEYQLRPVWVHMAQAPGMQPAAGNYASVRRNPFDRERWDVLGVGLTDEYVLHTPEEVFAFGEHVIDQGHPLAALGSIDHGKRAFAAFRLDDVLIGGKDQVHSFLNVLTSFDGSMATHVRVSYIRVECSNTFEMVMEERATRSYRVRHSGAALSRRVDDARKSLEIGWRGLEKFQREADRWLQRKVGAREFDRVVERLMPMAVPGTGPGVSQVRAKRDRFRALYESAATNRDITGTAWGVLNAYTEWVDWTRGSYPSTEARVAAQMNPDSSLHTQRSEGSRTIARMLGLEPTGAGGAPVSR